MPQVKVRLESGQPTAGDGREIEQASANEVSTGKIASAGIFANLAITQAKKAINYSINNIGNFTGDYIMQKQFQQTTELFGNVAGIVAGGLALGPAGAIVAAVGVGLNYAFETISIAQNIKKENYQAQYLAERGGDVYNDGSRGTQN